MSKCTFNGICAKLGRSMLRTIAFKIEQEHIQHHSEHSNDKHLPSKIKQKVQYPQKVY
jgi:hypothetical protein